MGKPPWKWGVGGPEGIETEMNFNPEPVGVREERCIFLRPAKGV
jgi:hypothetical protein